MRISTWTQDSMLLEMWAISNEDKLLKLTMLLVNRLSPILVSSKDNTARKLLSMKIS